MGCDAYALRSANGWARHMSGTPKKSAKRQTMTIVFADVSGFGSMSEAEVETFSEALLPKCTELASNHDTIYCNTWGDAIVAYFGSVEQALNYALELRDIFRDGRDFSAGGYRKPPAIRVSMHMADVFISASNATPGGKIYGTQVSFAARIEPITAPNEVFASETLAPSLRSLKRDSIVVTPLGKVVLPKESHREKIFWIRRRGESGQRPAALLKPAPLRSVHSTDLVIGEIASGPKIRKLRVQALNCGSSMHALLGMAENHLRSGAQISILVWDPDCSQLPPPTLVDESVEDYLAGLKARVPSSEQASAACEYLMQASELTAWSNDDQALQLSRLRERLSTCVRNTPAKGVRVRLLKTPRWIPARSWLVDGLAYVTNYWQPKVLSPIIVAEERNPLFEAVNEHFDYVWNEAEKLSDAKLFEATSTGTSRRG